MQKNKILSVCIVLIFGLAVASGLFYSQIFRHIDVNSKVSATIKPQVLAENIDLRGTPEIQPGPIVPDLSAKDLAKVSAKSFLVYDLSDGNRVLAEFHPDQKLGIASLTKLMTGLVTYQVLNFSETLKINRNLLTQIRPTVDFVQNDEVLVKDVFDAMVVGSCNDAALALAQAARQSAGVDMVKLMNAEAENLNMSQTNFSNPVGFDSLENYSTALDLQKLVGETQKLAAFSNLGKTSQLNFSGVLGLVYKVKSTNGLIEKYDDIFAIKTGFTKGTNGSMISKIIKDNHEIIIIVLGSGDREADTLLLKSLIVDPLYWQ